MSSPRNPINNLRVTRWTALFRKEGLVHFAAIALMVARPFRVSASGGTSGGTVLSIPVGARAIAMGEAYTAQADDASSLYWNPAGLALLNQSQASFMFNSSLQDQTYQNAAIATPLEHGGIGGSLSYLTYGTINGFNSQGVPTTDVTAYSGVGTLGGGLLLGPLSVGANLKGVQSQLADVSATGVAADVGGIWTMQQDVLGGTLRAGATVRNMGSGLKFIDQTDPFPLEYRLGVAAVQMMSGKLNYSIDYGKQRDVKQAIYTGAEYWLVPMLALRLGYAGTDQEGNGLRLGIGIRVRDFSFDYAYSSYGDLGMSHRYEVSMRFGAVRPTLTPEERAMLKRARLAMAQGRYDEAALLLDSLRTMEPRYRLFARLEKVALRGSEDEGRLASSPRSLNLTGPAQDNDAENQDELTTLMQSSDDALASTDTKSKTEESTLAPMIPTNPLPAEKP